MLSNINRLNQVGGQSENFNHESPTSTFHSVGIELRDSVRAICARNNRGLTPMPWLISANVNSCSTANSFPFLYQKVLFDFNSRFHFIRTWVDLICTQIS